MSPRVLIHHSSPTSNRPPCLVPSACQRPLVSVHLLCLPLLLPSADNNPQLTSRVVSLFLVVWPSNPRVIFLYFFTFDVYFILIFISYWSSVDLQCCIRFGGTAKWSSYTYIYPFFFRFFPHIDYYRILSREFSVCYSRSLLVIYDSYSRVYLLIPYSSFIPPRPVPFGIHKFVFQVCESVSVL